MRVKQMQVEVFITKFLWWKQRKIKNYMIKISDNISDYLLLMSMQQTFCIAFMYLFFIISSLVVCAVLNFNLI